MSSKHCFVSVTLEASRFLNLPDWSSTCVFGNQLSLLAVSNCDLHLQTGRSIFSIISPCPLTPVKSTVWQASFKSLDPSHRCEPGSLHTSGSLSAAGHWLKSHQSSFLADCSFFHFCQGPQYRIFYPRLISG